MKKTLQDGIIALIRSALCSEASPLPDGFDLAAAEKMICNHQIGSLVYEGAIKCNIDPQLPVMRDLFGLTYQHIYVDENQRRMLAEVLEAFDRNGIDYMPLKGVLLKSLYPRPDMRVMGDADVLIKLEQYDRIRPIMLELGFTEKLESDHELVWTKSCLYLELHKRVIPSYNKDYAAYFGNGWRLAKPCPENPNCHKMSAEDQLLYLVTHFAKHYRSGGVGIRHMTDLYLYKKANPQMDEAYINRELQTLQLCAFYGHLCDTLRAWFEDGAHNEKTLLITHTVFNSGSFGTNADRMAAVGARSVANGNRAKNVRWKQLLQVMFPSSTVLSERYPVLKTLPVLLPIMWVVRWVSAVLFRSENIKKQHNRMQLMKGDQINRYEQSLKAVDLTFHFEE